MCNIYTQILKYIGRKSPLLMYECFWASSVGTCFMTFSNGVHVGMVETLMGELRCSPLRRTTLEKEKLLFGCIEIA